MRKKILLATLMICVGLNGFAKSQPFSSAEAAIEADKDRVKKELNESFFPRLKTTISTGNGQQLFDKSMKNAKGSSQFLCQQSKIADLYENGKESKKAAQLGEIVNKLKNKNILPSNVEISPLKVVTNNIEDSENEVTYTFRISFDARTTTPAIGNNSKYHVDLYFSGTLKKKIGAPIENGKTIKNAEKIVVGYEIKKKAEFKSSTVVAKNMFDSESACMRKKADEKINEWYRNVPTSIDSRYDKYINDSIGIHVDHNKNIEIKQNGKTFTAIGKPIDIDYVPVIADSIAYLYTNPIATLSITPIFKIVFDDNYKNIISENIVSDYKEEKREATTDPDKKSRYQSASNAINNFGGILSQYVADNNKEIRENAMEIFTDSKNDEVAVSHRSKSDKEIINQRKAAKYLQRLKGIDLTFETIEFLDSNMTSRLNAENPELDLNFDPNLYTIMFDVIQRYEGNGYKDKTRKIIVMKRQNDNSYLIEKIIVVPNSTTLVE